MLYNLMNFFVWMLLPLILFLSLRDLWSDLPIDFNVKKMCAIGHLNISGLLTKFYEVVHYLLSDKYHFVCLTDTLLHKLINDNLVEANKYKLLRQDWDPHIKIQGGGLCV